MKLLAEFVITAVTLGALDFFWLTVVAKKVYFSAMGSILKDAPKMVPALIFYLIYIVGVVLLVIDPAIHSGSLISAVVYGGLFGLVAYSTYDLTNLSTLKGFKLSIAVLDIIWGTILTAIVAGVTYGIYTSWIG